MGSSLWTLCCGVFAVEYYVNLSYCGTLVMGVMLLDLCYGVFVVKSLLRNLCCGCYMVEYL